ISHMPEGNRISPGKLEAYFKAADAGAHPYLNGTIRLEIQADGYTESWQQQVLKSFAKKSS
ncbi:MAG: hypothetical protein WCB15_20455, partial [Desulfobacterales bacterium]